MTGTPKTVFITGASSGIGLETALYFFDKGWNVVATMRNPEKRRTPLHEKNLPDLIHLDVLDEASIQNAIEYALNKYQTIDVLVNNAGYAVYGPFEATTPAQIQKEFDTNVTGLMAVTKSFLPIFCRQQGGVLINVASMGGRVGFPLYSVYNSTKWAVEGFSEALMYELKPLNIRVRLIEPGVIKTDFYDRSLDRVDCSNLADAYESILERSKKSMGERATQQSSDPSAVAQVIYKAATDTGWQLRYMVGMDAKMVNFLRWLLPERVFYWILEKATLN